MEVSNIKTGNPSAFTLTERLAFVQLLEKQGKVRHPSIEKIDRCLFLSMIVTGEEIVSIGAIKPKTNSDFDQDKSGMEKLRDKFDWEIGYCYTIPDHTKKGHSSRIVHDLLEKTIKINLIGSTELSGSSMRKIIERFGFKHVGKPWKSGIHGAMLGLFIKEAAE